jgi:GNAT superfamily N-acetyltransferase
VDLPDGVTLRTATPEDVDAGAALHAACWREAYAGLVDPTQLEKRIADTDRWREGWATQLAAGPPRVLAVAGGELIGFGVAGPSRKPDAPVAQELYALYTRAAWWGTGVGQALLEVVAPAGPCWLFVLEGNLRARAFYRRNGFVPDGHRQHYRGLDAWEIRMIRP